MNRRSLGFTKYRAKHVGPRLVFSHVQAAASAHDIDNGINCADFMKMNLRRRLAVNLAFGHGDALKNSDRLFFDPGGKGTALNEMFDLLECSAMFVLRSMRVSVGVL